MRDEPITLDTLLSEARQGLNRLTPREAFAQVERGAALIDVRTAAQIGRDGAVPQAACIERNVLEWRLEPGGEHSIPELADPSRRLIVLCDAGFQSSLAAANLRRMGLDATDVSGGFQNWRAAGLPVVAPD